MEQGDCWFLNYKNLKILAIICLLREFSGMTISIKWKYFLTNLTFSVNQKSNTYCHDYVLF